MTELPDRDLILDVAFYDAVLVGMNNYGQMSNGFPYKVRKLYPEVHKADLTTKYADPEKIGTTLTVEGKPAFMICYVCKGYNFRPDMSPVFVDYDAVAKCLRKAAREFKGKRVATTYIGSSRFDGNGDPEKIKGIFKKCLENADVDVTVYTYFQKSKKEEEKEEWDKMKEVRETDRVKYHELCAKRRKEREEGKKTSGWM